MPRATSSPDTVAEKHSVRPALRSTASITGRLDEEASPSGQWPASRLTAAGIHIPSQFLGMLPYLLTIVVVAGAVGRSIAPAPVGKPYRKT